MPPPWRWTRPLGARPLVYAHRGARAHAPENTLQAFERGRLDGADGIELDVRTTRDGVVVVVHDQDLKRVTDGRDVRAIMSTTLAELRRIELTGNAFVPTLAEVLDWADAHEPMRVNVELKHDAHDLRALAFEVARLLRGRARVAERVMVSSFEPKLLGWSALYAPKIPRAFLVHEKQRFAKTIVARAIAAGVGAVAIHPERTLCSPSRVALWRAHDLLVNVWTVNDPREGKDLARLGVDGLITDDPAAVLAAL